MFETPNLERAVIKGKTEDSSFISIYGNVNKSQNRILRRLAQFDRNLTDANILSKLLGTLRVHIDWSYDEVLWQAKMQLNSLGSVTDASVPNDYGKPLIGEFIPMQDELYTLVAEPIEPDVTDSYEAPMRWLWHEHTNINWMLPEQGEGLAIIEVNVVALMWKWIQQLRIYERIPDTPRHTIGVWLYKEVFIPSLISYQNISVFNRRSDLAWGGTLERDPINRTIQYPEIDKRLNQHIEKVDAIITKRDMEPADILYHYPTVFKDPVGKTGTALDLVVQPEDKTITWQQRWVYELVDLFIARGVLSYDSRIKSKHKSPTLRLIRELRQRHIIEKMPSHLSSYINSNLFDVIETLF